MADPMVRVVGELADADGTRFAVGVDYDTVTIGFTGLGAVLMRFTSAQAEEFARLFVAACWEAAGQRAAMAEADRA